MSGSAHRAGTALHDLLRLERFKCDRSGKAPPVDQDMDWLPPKDWRAPWERDCAGLLRAAPSNGRHFIQARYVDHRGRMGEALLPIRFCFRATTGPTSRGCSACPRATSFRIRSTSTHGNSSTRPIADGCPPAAGRSPTGWTWRCIWTAPAASVCGHFDDLAPDDVAGQGHEFVASTLACQPASPPPAGGLQVHMKRRSSMTCLHRSVSCRSIRSSVSLRCSRAVLALASASGELYWKETLRVPGIDFDFLVTSFGHSTSAR